MIKSMSRVERGANPSPIRISGLQDLSVVKAIEDSAETQEATKVNTRHNNGRRQAADLAIPDLLPVGANFFHGGWIDDLASCETGIDTAGTCMFLGHLVVPHFCDEELFRRLFQQISEHASHAGLHRSVGVDEHFRGKCRHFDIGAPLLGLAI